MRALQDMGLLPAFITGTVWRYTKWATFEAVAHPYAYLERLRSFARACDGRAQWPVYGMAVVSFTCLPRVGEAAPIKRGGSRSRGLGFHTGKYDPHFVRRKLGSYLRAWLRWLDREGSTSARRHTSVHKGPPTSRWSWQMPSADVKAPTRGGMRGGGVGRQACASWVCRSDGSLCLDRWMPESVAAHYGDAAHDFAVADNVELPWPIAQGDMAWEWRVLSLKDMFPGELLALFVRERDVGPEEDLE